MEGKNGSASKCHCLLLTCGWFFLLPIWIILSLPSSFSISFFLTPFFPFSSLPEELRKNYDWIHVSKVKKKNEKSNEKSLLSFESFIFCFWLPPFLFLSLLQQFFLLPSPYHQWVVKIFVWKIIHLKNVSDCNQRQTFLHLLFYLHHTLLHHYIFDMNHL